MLIFKSAFRFCLALATGVIPSSAYAIIAGTPSAKSFASPVFMFEWAEGRCSATAVGRRAFLTAAHCVQGAGKARILVGGSTFGVVCEKHPDYAAKFSADFALCGADEDLPLAGLARVNTEAGRLTVGKRVVLVGYGCTARGGGDVGQVKKGDAVITAIPHDRSPTPNEDDLYTTTQGAASCAGDGGGGLFEPLSLQAGQPVLLGVLSRGDQRQVSFAATVSTPTFLSFARSWSDGNRQAICGIDASGDACELPAVGVTFQPSLSRNSATPIIAGVVYKAGERVLDIVSRVCGPQELAYYDLLQKYHDQTTGWDITSSTRFQSDGEIDLPTCGKAAPAQVKLVTTKKGDTPRTLFKREADRSQWTTFAASGPATTDTSSFMTAYQALNPKLDVKVPLKPGTVVALPPVPVSPQNLPMTSLGLQPSEPRAELAKTDGELQSGQQCKGSNQDTYPYDMTALLDVLASNRAASPTERSTVTVLVGDNGLFLSKLGAFGDRILMTTEEERSHLDAYRAKFAPIQAGSKLKSRDGSGLAGAGRTLACPAVRLDGKRANYNQTGPTILRNDRAGHRCQYRQGNDRKTIHD
jgi:hypothetical protein